MAEPVSGRPAFLDLLPAEIRERLIDLSRPGQWRYLVEEAEDLRAIFRAIAPRRRRSAPKQATAMEAGPKHGARGRGAGAGTPEHGSPADRGEAQRDEAMDADGDYWLVSLFASDARALEDNAFKVWCVLSAPTAPDGTREWITLEYPLPYRDGRPYWRPIRGFFRAALPLEQELADLFGIDCRLPPRASRPVLIGDYATGFAPLRRGSDRESAPPRGPLANPPRLPEGVMVLPVGPIHAGIIQPGYFAFQIGGEVVEKLPVQLGFTHRGIEKLFEGQRLLEGWKLADVVTGDSAFAHSLAYCLAVESLAGFEPSPEVQHWRALLLELERIINHMADCAAIVHDMAFDALSSPLTVVQERAVRLARELTGNRLLRGVNRPGGIELPRAHQDALPRLAGRIEKLVDDFLDLALPVMQEPQCRDRLISTGVLTRREALFLGATGLPARASGVLSRDFRLRHPWGVYRAPGIRTRIEATAQDSDVIDWTRRVPVRAKRKQLNGEEKNDNDQRIKGPTTTDLTGDVFARTWLRLAELEACRDLIGPIVEGLRAPPDPTDLDPALRAVEPFDFGIGCVEAWRGEVCYWVQKGPRGSIYRCKVRDPSVFNWPALAQAVECKDRHAGEPGAGPRHENILADFPLINKSFNLSYAGTDL